MIGSGHRRHRSPGRRAREIFSHSAPPVGLARQLAGFPHCCTTRQAALSPSPRSAANPICVTPSLPATANAITNPRVSTNTLTEIRNVRLGKAAALRNLGLNPYPSRSRRTHYAKAILDDFAGHEGKVVTVAGRLMSWRKQGALAFGHVQDQTGRIQLFLRRQLVQADRRGGRDPRLRRIEPAGSGRRGRSDRQGGEDGARRDFGAGGEAAPADQGHPAAARPMVRA